MLIGIDGNEANVEMKVGSSVYTLELLKYFHKKASKNMQFVVYLKNEPKADLPKQSEYFRYKRVWGPGLWRDIFLPIALYTGARPDVFFSPAHYTPRFSSIPVVVTIHDLSNLYFPGEFLKKDLYKLEHWTQHALTQAEKIIAVSKSTKRDIIRKYDVYEKQVEVIYNGYSKKVSSMQYAVSRIKNLNTKYSILNTKYLLYVGTIQPRKNIQTLIEAFRMVLGTYPDLKLVIVGKKGWLYEKIYDSAHHKDLKKHVIFTGYLPDSHVATLYKNAYMFVLPSFYEGFGIPILEAMSHSCPVIASKVSSLPEIGGDACLYFDPHDAIQLKQTIIKLLDDESLRRDLVKKGKKRIKQFSWEKCGRSTLKILEEVASQTN